MSHLLFMLRQWQRRPARALLTAASVAVAVGAVLSTWVAAEASRSGYRRLAESIEGRPAVDIVAGDGGRWDAGRLTRFTDIRGVRAAVPLLVRPTLLRSGESRVREIAVGMDVVGLVDAGLLQLDIGRPCESSDEVVLARRLADSLAKNVGDTVLMLSKRGVRRLTITGIAATQSLGSFTDGGGVALDLGALGALAGTGGLVDRVRLILHEAASRDAVVAAANRRLPNGIMAVVPPGRAGIAAELVSVANLGLDFVTGLTVAMAWLIVGNAMLMNVTERRRGFALQRLVGATRRQIERQVVVDAAILGAVGAVVGTIGGLWAAAPIARGVAQAIRAPDVVLSASPWVVALAALTGPVVAVAAAWWPARRAAAVDLLEGLGHVAPAPERLSWRLGVIAAALWAAASGILLAVVMEWLPPRAAVPAGIATMLAFTALTPIVLPPLARALVRVVPGAWRIEAALALEQVLRQPVRTALTTAVLVVAVTNGVGLGHAILASVDDVLGWYRRALQADWMLLPAGSLALSRDASPSANADLVEELRGVPDVVGMVPLSLGLASVEGRACMIVARDLPADGDPPLQAVGMSAAELRRQLAGGGMAIGTALARQLNRGVGDEVVVSAFGTTVRLPIAAVVTDYMAGGTSLFLTRTTARRIFGIDSVDVLLVAATPGKSETLRGPLQAIADRRGLLLQSNREVRSMMDRILDGLVGGLWAILGLGFVVGSLGVANTVTMNVLEKRRTLGLLRTLGMSGGRVLRLVFVESLLLGLAGCTIGIVAGVATAVFIQVASQPLLGHPLAISIRPSVLLANLAGALVVTLLAAWFPARRAVGLDLLEAIAAE